MSYVLIAGYDMQATKEEIAEMFKIDAVRTVTIENCFAEPAVWDEKSKSAYTEWHSKLPDSHPSKSNPTPWQDR